MNRSNAIKLLAGFAVGVVVMLVLLIYSRTPELNRVAVGENEVTSTKPKWAQVPERAVPTQGSAEAQLSDGVPEPVQKNTVPAEVPRAHPRDNPAATASRKPKAVTLRRGASLTVQLAETVSTDRNRSGDLFRGTLDSPLIVSGSKVAERGSNVVGQIVAAKSARLIGGKSNLSLVLREISTADGQRVRIETSPWEARGAHSSIAEGSKMAAGAAFGAVVGAFSGAARGVGLVSGKDAGSGTDALVHSNKRILLLPIGARLTFQLAAPVTIIRKAEISLNAR